MRQRRFLLGALLSLSLGLAVQAQTPSTLPVEIRIPGRTVAFRGSDGNVHLCYEATITNLDRKGRKLTVNRIDVLDDSKPTSSIGSFTGAELEAILSHPGLPEPGAGARVISGGMRASVWMWLSIDGTATPAAIRHRLTFSLETVEGERVVDCCFTTLDPPLVLLSAPLRGGNWAAANGPSNSSDHRRAVATLNGQTRDGQRFAIDWVRFGENGKLTKTDGAANVDYYGYGQNVLAVADAAVADIKDGIPENKPGSIDVPIDMGTIAGNFVVLDLGNGMYAGYAHLQPGSLRVKKGDRVHRGDVLGLLGNSGNSDAPHLHFQLMDAASILDSEGLPFLLDSFTVVGISDKDDKFQPAKQPTDHKREMPLENVVVSFPTR
jgi:murein DD-endopeptidase MepM/ murein hydrolase activator NlpD